jgi:hypothetical protein
MSNTWRFIIFSVITNIYNKKIKEPTLMELFTATGKLKKFFFDNYSCLMYEPRVTRHTSIRYSNSCHARVNMGAWVPKGTVHCSSEEYRCTHIDACVART